MNNPDNIAVNAAVTYLKRKLRFEHPKGDFDRYRRWYPSSTETCECCESLKNPTKSYPFTLLTHCRTIKHIAQLHKAKISDIRYLLKRKSLPLLIGIDAKIDAYIEQSLKELL